MTSRSKRVVAPVTALLRRRLSGRWWDEDTRTSDAPLPDLPALGDRQTLDDGVGATIRRTYRIRLPANSASPTDLIAWFRRDRGAQAPVDYAAFDAPITEVGQHLTVELAGPWDGPVEVIELTDDSVLLATLEGHMEAGYIRFSASDDDGWVTFEIQSVARAGDPAFWALHVPARVGRWVQADMWSSLLENAARAHGVANPERIQVETVSHPAQTKAPA